MTMQYTQGQLARWLIYRVEPGTWVAEPPFLREDVNLYKFTSGVEAFARFSRGYGARGSES